MENNEKPQNEEFYQEIHSLHGEIPSREDIKTLSTDQKSAIVTQLRDSGLKVVEVAERTGLSKPYVYKLLKHNNIPEMVSLESKTYLENFLEKKAALESRISSLSKVIKQETPKYANRVCPDTGEIYKIVLSGSVADYERLCRVRFSYEKLLLELEQKAQILPNRDNSAYNTISESKPEELAKEDVENLTDTELLMKLVADLKRNGKSGSLASLKDEKILGG